MNPQVPRPSSMRKPRRSEGPPPPLHSAKKKLACDFFLRTLTANHQEPLQACRAPIPLVSLQELANQVYASAAVPVNGQGGILYIRGRTGKELCRALTEHQQERYHG